MKLSRDSIKRSVLGLATLSSMVVGVTAAVPGVHAASPQRHVYTFKHDHDNYRDCGGYSRPYWGYSYGYYYGADLESDFGSSGYHGGDYWYLGYYPDHWYSNRYSSSQPRYSHHHDYDCFEPPYQH